MNKSKSKKKRSRQEGRWLRHIERTVRGSGDRAKLGEPSAQSMLRIGARSAIAFDFNTENETALPNHWGVRGDRKFVQNRIRLTHFAIARDRTTRQYRELYHVGKVKLH